MDWELHFRASVEPCLERNQTVPDELYRLAREARFAELASRLSVDWLRRYPALNFRIQTELLACALKGASEVEMRALLKSTSETVPTPIIQPSSFGCPPGYVVHLERPPESA